MIGSIVAWSLRWRVLVVLAVLALGAIGVRAWLALPLDAVPDTTNVQVQVLTNAPGLSPLEVEQLVTRPVELAMTGIPGVEHIRSTSRAAVSAVTVVFRDDVDFQLARSLVSQRLPAAREAIPASSGRPEVGPFTTGLGEIYHFTIAWPGHSPREVRTLFDWEIAYALRSVPGVVEVNGWGGDSRQVEVRLRDADLRALRVSQMEVEDTLLGGGANAGGGALVRGEEQVLVRLDGQYRTVDDVADQIVTTRDGVAIRVRDVATVRDGSAFRQSAATADGKGETVYGMVQMIAAGNAHEVAARVKARLADIEKRLPAGAKIEPFYDRASLVDKVLATVKRSLLEGGIVVVVVLLAFLGDVSAGLIVATAIPISMLGAFAMMQALGMSGNLMSLGAIDFGLVVDGAVVVVEGALASMATRRFTARMALEEEGRAVGTPIAFGVFIIGVVYAPVLMLEGVEGKMFRPMAWTVLFALGTSLVLAFTWIPAVASIVLRKAHEGDVWLVRWIRRVYAPVLDAFVRRPLVAAALAVALVAVGLVAGAGRGAEFVPRLEEGDLAIQITRPPSVSLEEAVRGTTDVERVLRTFPEVRRVVSRTGSPDVATDVMGVEQSDVFVILAPRGEWKSAHTREELVERMSEALQKALPGTSFGFTQPIEMRFQELLGGMKSDVGVKVHGDDLATLTRLGEEIRGVLEHTQGVADVRMEPTTGLPLATIRPNLRRAARLGVRIDEVRAAVESLRAGRDVGLLVDGERRFPVVVRADAPPPPTPAQLAAFPLVLEGGRMLSLGDVADVNIEEGPAQVSREAARRRVLVECNVRGRDLAGFVQEAQRKVGAIAMPPGYYVTFSGQYENLEHAATRLAIVVPATLGAIFLVLYLAFHEVVPALLIFLNVPVAASGGLIALWARNLPLSISAAVGFIALFGVATLNGVVLLSAVMRREEDGLPPKEAAREAAHQRLRPVLTTAVVASLGFLPMAIATGTGAEVQRPLATVVMGGLGTATLLTLGVLPALWGLVRRPRED
jgi:cobalt-zinc-cadmium resistance protein CzcA